MSHKEPNRLSIILILGALSTISPFAIDMYLPAFHEIAADLHTTATSVSLSISSYFAGLAVGQICCGPLLDRFGRKRPLYVGLGVFILASLLCMLSKNVGWLIAMRFLQALGGCTAQVAAMAMVRDFFPVKDTAKIISLLILILGVSPLLAPTVGTYVSLRLGWQWVFILLAAFAALNVVLLIFFLPEGHEPDPSVSLHPLPILRNFMEVLKDRQFITYAGSGALVFSGLLVYVTGSSIIFQDVFHVDKPMFSKIFALLSVGFIGSNQVNTLLLRKFTSEQLYRMALFVDCPVAMLFLAGAFFGWLNLWAAVALLFIVLSTLGLAFPNAAALALSSIDHNIGSASSMLGFLQIGASCFASASIGLFPSDSMLTAFGTILVATSWLGIAALYFGRRGIKQLKFVEEKGAHPVGH